MKRIVLISAIALLAACGSTKSDVTRGAGTSGSTPASAVAAAGSPTSGPLGTAAGSDDTIVVDNFGDMPPKCVDLFTAFLKKIEPTASKIDWQAATLADFEAFGKQFQADSDSFDTQTAAAGCDKYNLSGSDEAQFQQMTELAAVEAPGTLGFLTFLTALASASTPGDGSIPADCAGTIAAIEPFLGAGKTIKGLTMAQITVVGRLMSGVSKNCTEAEASDFFARDDVKTFVGN
jgi:hypothetical protein